MTITDAELIRALAISLGGMIAAFYGIAIWVVRSIKKELNEFKQGVTNELRGLDRRVTRIEAVVRIPTPMYGPDGDYFRPLGENGKAP